MKKSIFLIGVTFLSLSANAITPTYKLEYNGSTKVETLTQSISSVQIKSTETKVLHTLGSTYDVTIDMVYNAEDFSPSMIHAYGPNVNTYLPLQYDENWQPLPQTTVQMAEGTYDICITFNDKKIDGSKICIIKENITVDNNLSLTFDVADANQVIEFSALMPNGSAMTLNTVDPQSGTILEYGNINNMGMFNVLYHEDYGMLEMSMGILIGAYPDFNPERSMDCRINQIGDKYKFAQVRIAEGDEQLYGIGLYCNDITSQVICNKSESYNVVDGNFQYTPAKEITTGENLLPIQYILGLYLGGGYVASMSAQPEDYFDKMNFACGGTDEFSDLDILFAVNKAPIDALNERQESWGVMQETYRTVFPPMCFNEGKAQYITSRRDNPFSRVIKDNKTSNPCIPANAPFCTFISDNLMLIGNTAPINSLDIHASEFGQNQYYMNISPYYYGQLGELRESDVLQMDYEIKYNGEIVSEKGVFINDWSSAWSETEHEPGIYEFSFTNKNVVVDGIDGKNVTTTYTDWRTGDKEAPTIQALTFVDANDMRTNHFDNAESGTLLFAAGDFNYCYNNELYTGYFECAPIDVTVEWSDYGNENWKKLDVKEVEDGYYMPGYGYLYKSELRQVDVKSANTWYDLRIQLTDAVGNKQTQIISPAFSIDETSFINNPIRDNIEEEYGERIADGEVDIVTIDGKQVAGVLAPGIYIVLSKKDNEITSHKIVVK